MLKFWDLTQGQIREPIYVQYEHEEAILGADLHPKEDTMASVDAEGQVICRSFKNPDDLKSQFRPQDDSGEPQEPPEMAVVRFNGTKSDELFVSINNALYTYVNETGEYMLKRHYTFNANVVSIVQDCDTLLLCCDNDSLIVYDWQTGKVNDEWTDFAQQAGHLCVRGEKGWLLAGTKEGDVRVFRS